MAPAIGSCHCTAWTRSIRAPALANFCPPAQGSSRRRIALLGCSFGGSLAAKIAAVCCHRLDRLNLVDAVGTKLGDRESRDILDLVNTQPAAKPRRTSEHGQPARCAPERHNPRWAQSTPG